MKTAVRILRLLGYCLAAFGVLISAGVDLGNAAPLDFPARGVPSQSVGRQNPAVPEPENDPPYRIARIGAEQGISSSEAWGVVRDDQGFIWIGTMDGLNRYDAYGMKVFKHDLTDPTSLSDNAIRSLYVDGAGTLWIGGWFNGLNRFDHETETFTRFQHDPDDPNSLSNNTINAILEDRSGKLWLGTRGGLNRFDPATGQFTAYLHDPDDPDSLVNDGVFALAEDEDGTLWVGTDGGLDHFDPATGTFRHYQNDSDDPASLSSDVIRALFVDELGDLWVGTWGGGLNRLDRQLDTFVQYRHDPDDPNSLNNDGIFVIKQADNGHLWIGTFGGGPARFDPQTGRFQRLGFGQGGPWPLDSSSISGALEVDGLLWLTTTDDVFLADLHPKPFRTFQHDPDNVNSLAANEINAIYEDPQRILWVATGSTGLNRIDRSTGEVSQFQENPEDPAGSSANEIWEIAPDPDGTLWLATFGSGLANFDPETGEAVYFRNDANDPASLASDIATAVLRDQSGRLWIGTWDSGLDSYDPETGIFSHYVHDPDDPTSLSSNTITMLSEDHRGDLWIGTLSGGFNRFDSATNSFIRYQGKAGDSQRLLATGVSSVVYDRSGRLWAGLLGGGLVELDADTGELIMQYSSRNDLPSDSILSILEDELGHLWLGTANGLSRFDPDTGAIRNYDMGDGLPSNVFETSTSFQSPSGELFFGTSAGLLAFYPDQIEDSAAVAPVVITDLLLNNESVSVREPDSTLERAINWTDSVALSYLDRVVSFEFTALSYLAPQKIRYRYMLEGFDETWNEVGSNRRLVTYTNLNPGDYRFQVQASNADGIWPEASRTSLALTIAPPWWKTPWFRLSTGLLVVTLVSGGLLLQRRNDTLQQRKLERLVDERTRELQDARTQISTLFDSSPLGIYLMNPAGRILTANRSMLRIFGYDEDELLQTNARALYKDPKQDIQEMVQTGDVGVQSDRGILLQRQDGSLFFGNLNLNRLEVDGEALMLGVVDDITEEVETRQALTVLHQISYDLASIVELEPLLDHAFRQLRKIVDYRHAVLLLDEQGNESSTLQAYIAGASQSEFDVTQISTNDWSFLRNVLNESEAIYVPDMQANETFQIGIAGLKIERLADALKTSRSLLDLPMVAGERFVGMLNILHDSVDAYNASEVEVARTFANQLAIAIDNVYLNKQAQQAAAEHERSRIARDLHDSVTQTLFTASMIAESTPRIWDRDSDLARQNLGRISLLTRGALAEMRSLLVELRSGVLAGQPLEQLIETLVEATRARSNAVVALCVDCRSEPPPETVMAFYRIAQEILNNATKHAEATQIKISLTCKRDDATLEISDDGRGFHPQAVADGRLGLRIMAERAAEIGGDLEVKSSPGQGTQIRLRWLRLNEGENHG